MYTKVKLKELKEKLLGYKLKKLSNEKNLIKIPYDDKVKLLSLLYKFNHGDKECSPFEYSCKLGMHSNGVDGYKDFKHGIELLGYKIDDVIVEDNFKAKMMTVDDAEIIKKDYEKRKSNNQLYPHEIKYFILKSPDDACFKFMETPDTLEFLAKAGNQYAVATYNNWVRKLGVHKAILDIEGKVNKKR